MTTEDAPATVFKVPRKRASGEELSSLDLPAADIDDRVRYRLIK